MLQIRGENCHHNSNTSAFISNIGMTDILESLIDDFIKRLWEKRLKKKILAYKEKLRWKINQESSNVTE